MYLAFQTILPRLAEIQYPRELVSHGTTLGIPLMLYCSQCVRCFQPHILHACACGCLSFKPVPQMTVSCIDSAVVLGWCWQVGAGQLTVTVVVQNACDRLGSADDSELPGCEVL